MCRQAFLVVPHLPRCPYTPLRPCVPLFRPSSQQAVPTPFRRAPAECSIPPSFNFSFCPKRRSSCSWYVCIDFALTSDPCPRVAKHRFTLSPHGLSLRRHRVFSVWAWSMPPVGNESCLGGRLPRGPSPYTPQSLLAPLPVFFSRIGARSAGCLYLLVLPSSNSPSPGPAVFLAPLLRPFLSYLGRKVLLFFTLQSPSC